VVRYDRATQTVVEVGLFADWTVVRFPEASKPCSPPCRMPSNGSRPAGTRFAHEDLDLICDALGLELRLTAGPAPGWKYPASRWVDALTFRMPAR
jgi:hypothetical protein